VKSHGDCTYTILYNDGDTETAVPEKFMCAVAKEGQFRIGETVEARFGGKAKWFGGAIAQDNGNGTYAIRYHDGDMEPSVAFVRRPQQAAAAAARPLGSDATSAAEAASPTPAATASTAIEDRLNKQTAEPSSDATVLCDQPAASLAKSQKTPPPPSADNGDDDDENPAVPTGKFNTDAQTREQIVAGETQATESDESEVATDASFEVGDVVDALFGGGKKYFTGKVVKSHGDCTYTILYNDGDTETAVPEKFMCAVAKEGQFRIGETVEARFGGKAKWFGGAIAQDNGNGTYAIRYHDGDMEPSVAFVRRPQQAAAAAARPLGSDATSAAEAASPTPAATASTAIEDRLNKQTAEPSSDATVLCDQPAASLAKSQKTPPPPSADNGDDDDDDDDENPASPTGKFNTDAQTRELIVGGRTQATASDESEVATAASTAATAPAETQQKVVRFPNKSPTRESRAIPAGVAVPRVGATAAAQPTPPLTAEGERSASGGGDGGHDGGGGKTYVELELLVSSLRRELTEQKRTVAVLEQRCAAAELADPSKVLLSAEAVTAAPATAYTAGAAAEAAAAAAAMRRCQMVKGCRRTSLASRTT